MTTTLTETFAALFRRARRFAGLQQTDLARLTDKRQSYICRIETGGTSPSLDIVQLCAEAVGFTPLLVLLPQEDPATDDPELLAATAESLLDALRRLRNALTKLEPHLKG
jgi:transcriptional regulator with XRE-family HTH domain